MSSDTATPRRRSEYRRDELLDAAQELILDRGVTATAVSDITDKAGVAKGTFYLYFDSKDHIVAGLHGRLTEGMAGLVEDALSHIAEDGASRLTRDDFYRLVDECTAAIINYWIDQRELFRAIRESGETAEITQMKAEYDERIISMVEAGIQLGIQAGHIELPDPSRAAQFIYYGCQGSTTAELLAPGDIDRDGLVAAAEDIIRRVLRPS